MNAGYYNNNNYYYYYDYYHNDENYNDDKIMMIMIINNKSKDIPTKDARVVVVHSQGQFAGECVEERWGVSRWDLPQSVCSLAPRWQGQHLDLSPRCSEMNRHVLSFLKYIILDLSRFSVATINLSLANNNDNNVMFCRYLNM